MKFGIFPDIDINDYHGEKYKDYLGRGDLTRLMKSSAHYKAPRTKTETPEMIFGSAAHSLILENDESDIVCGPDVNKNTNVWKNFVKENDGKWIFDQSSIDTLYGMKEAFDKHKYAKALTNNAEIEMTFLWSHKGFDGTPCRSRPDILRRGEKIIVDYKTAKSAIPNEFSKSAVNNGYDIQARWYIDGVESQLGEGFSFYFIVQEKDQPYGIIIYQASKDLLKLGETKINKALTNYFNAKLTGNWECYPEEVIYLEPPAWALREI